MNEASLVRRLLQAENELLALKTAHKIELATDNIFVKKVTIPSNDGRAAYLHIKTSEASPPWPLLQIYQQSTGYLRDLVSVNDDTSRPDTARDFYKIIRGVSSSCTICAKSTSEVVLMEVSY